MKLIINFDNDVENRIDKEICEELSSSIINYLCHDYEEFFEWSYKLNEDGSDEVEIPPVEINIDVIK